MSATICPSCLSRSFESGRCGKCGFAAAEYKPPRTALPLGTVVGKYRIGVMKSNSRQSQIYAAAHTETSTPVIIEEFFPAKVVGRRPDSAEVSLVTDNEEQAQRFEQGCLLLEASAQKRPLNRLETFRANNTVYSVFEPAGTTPIAAQCEMMADYPYYFRDQNGMPMMSINLLTIPPMPALRDYNPEQYKKLAPVTQAADESDAFAGRLITENAAGKDRKKLITILGSIAAALVILVGVGFATGTIQRIIEKPTLTPAPELTAALTPEPTEAPTATQVPTATPIPEELAVEDFIPMLSVIPAEGTEIRGTRVERTENKYTVPEGAEEGTIHSDAKVITDGMGILRAFSEDEHTMKLCFILQDGEQLYRVEAGKLMTDESGNKIFEPNGAIQGLGFRLWKDVSPLKAGNTVLIDRQDKDANWLESLYEEQYWKDTVILVKENAKTDGNLHMDESTATAVPDNFGLTNGGKGAMLNIPQPADLRPELIIKRSDGARQIFPLKEIQEQAAPETPGASREGADGNEAELITNVKSQDAEQPTPEPKKKDGQSQTEPPAGMTVPSPEEENPENQELLPPDEGNGENPDDQQQADQPGEKMIELGKEEFVSCLQIIEKSGNDLVAREMKLKPGSQGKVRKVDDSVGKAGDEKGKVRIHSPRSVVLCEDTNNKEGLILEADVSEKQKNPNLYVITTGEGDVPGYRIQVGHIDIEKKEIKPEKNVELVIRLPKKLGIWDEGTKLSFETTEEENWLLTLMNNSPTINDSLREENVKFVLRINEDSGTPIPELKIGPGNGMTYTLKPLGADASQTLPGPAGEEKTKEPVQENAQTEDSKGKTAETEDSGEKEKANTGSTILTDQAYRNPSEPSGEQKASSNSPNNVLMEEEYSTTTIKIQTTGEVTEVQVKNESTGETIKLEPKNIPSAGKDYPLFWNQRNGGPIFSTAGTYTVICKNKDGTEVYRKEVNIQ